VALFISEGEDITMKDLTPIEICDRYVQGESGCEFQSDAEGGFCRLPEMFKCPVYEYFFYGQISVSQANTWMRCRRSYKHKYIDGIETLDKMLNKNMRIGRLIHEGAEMICSGKAPDVDYRRYFSEGDSRETGIVRIMLEKLVTLKKPDEPCLPEEGFTVQLPDCPEIRGVIDVLYAEHFDEFKTSGNPDYYLTPHYLQSQLGTYFLSDQKLKYCTMKVIRIPQLKSAGQYKDEDADKYVNRVRDDVNKRPAYYFIGLTDDSTWGKKFYRTEFDMKEIVERYRHIMRERRLAIKYKCWYKEESGCLYPNQCMYLQVCETGGVSELLYKRREKPVEE